MTAAAIDNDIIWKGLGYGLLHEFAQHLGVGIGDLWVLGASRFVVHKLLAKRFEEPERAVVLDALKKILDEASCLEPDEAELELAGRIETVAQQLGVQVDSGESLLCAAMLIRQFDWFVTGDKRAVVGLDLVATGVPEVNHLNGKVVCLEQLVRLCILQDAKSRAMICARPDLDKSLTIALSCPRQDVDEELCCEALKSYINHLSAQCSKITLAAV